MMPSLSIWLQATRPKTLAASLSPVILSGVLARPNTPTSWILWIMIALTAISIQILTNFANDYFDFLKGADTPERNGPTRVTASGLVSLPQMQRALRILTATTSLCGSVCILRGGWPFALLLCCALLFAYIYTAGPYPLAYLGLGDLFVFIFFGPVAVGAPYYLLTGQLEVTPFLMGLIPGSISTTLLVINNLRDVHEDRIAGKKTLVVRFGIKKGKGEVLFCLLISLLLPLLFITTHPLMGLVTLGVAYPTIRLMQRTFTNQDPKVYNQLLASTGQLLVLSTGLIALGWLY